MVRAVLIGRHAVQYWEAKALIRGGWAPRRMLAALGLPVFFDQYAQAGGWGLSPFAAFYAWCEARLAAELCRNRRQEALRLARRRVRCGAGPRPEKASPAGTRANPANDAASFMVARAPGRERQKARQGLPRRSGGAGFVGGRAGPSNRGVPEIWRAGLR